MDMIIQVQILEQVVHISLHVNVLGRSINLSLLSLVMGKIMGQTEFSSHGGTIGLGERKTLNSKHDSSLIHSSKKCAFINLC